MIHDITLPQKFGYIEVEINGKRYYQDADTLEIFDHDPPDKKTYYERVVEENKLLKAQIQAQTERADFVEDCIAEMAAVVYADDTTT